jgi:hypothetical protein
VCKWAKKTVGLSKKNVDVLRRQEIKGANFFKLTEEKLVLWGIPPGPAEALMDAVALVREPGIPVHRKLIERSPGGPVRPFQHV